MYISVNIVYQHCISASTLYISINIVYQALKLFLRGQHYISDVNILYQTSILYTCIRCQHSLTILKFQENISQRMMKAEYFLKHLD